MDIQIRISDSTRSVNCGNLGRLHHFKTLEGARRFAGRYMGDQFTVNTYRAISHDGISQITANVGLDLLFPYDCPPHSRIEYSYLLAQSLRAEDDCPACLSDLVQYKDGE